MYNDSIQLTYYLSWLFIYLNVIFVGLDKMLTKKNLHCIPFMYIHIILLNWVVRNVKREQNSIIDYTI